MEQLFDEVASLPPAQRDEYLRQRCPDDTGLRREVASLASSLEGAGEFLASHAAPAISHIGPYRIIREIGSGGMGTVYLAVRGDGQFRQQVAIKLARFGLPSEWARERFRQERQVMADLMHPNIARLLDGGATPEGILYLVMEYIDGQPITDYVVNLGLPVNARLRLFIGVCQAVAYAHRNLVVHRDIKPGNILVNATGTPKLLDFGISKLLDPMRADEKELTMPLMTPGYASPEQLRGESVSTAADIYSLGAVLHEMLTCESEPAGLPMDLAAIVEMAMRQEPAGRYPSADHFAADVCCYLDNRPVLARKGAFSYRMNKFVRRHRISVASVILLAITLLVGAACVLWQVHRVAEQVARAERRFIQFEKLANTFLFDFHTRIQSLKNLSEARELVLVTGLEYVDKLAVEAGDDPLFARELARAYDKFGNLQGFRHEVGMSRPAAALASYRKEIALLEPHKSTDPAAALMLSRAWCNAGEMSERLPGGLAEAKRSYLSCLELARQAPPSAPRISSTRLDLLFRCHELLGDLGLSLGDLASAGQHYQSIMQLLDTNEIFPERRRQVRLAEINRRLGRLQSAAGDHPAALASLRAARTHARLAAAGTDDNGVCRTLFRVQRDLALELNQSGAAGGPEARESAAAALAAAQRVSARLPHHPAVIEELQSARFLQAR